MQKYENIPALQAEIEKRAALFVQEFAAIPEAARDTLVDGVDRTPAQMLAYQLGWLDLMQSWETDEQAGNEVVTPAPGYKWNTLDGLYQQFYEQYQKESLAELQQLFQKKVQAMLDWLGTLTEEEAFQPGGRKWADTIASRWPVWRWVHINTVAPFLSFRTKIRKWKKLYGQ